MDQKFKKRASVEIQSLKMRGQKMVRPLPTLEPVQRTPQRKMERKAAMVGVAVRANLLMQAQVEAAVEAQA